MPERVQLRRAKGWKMPPNTVKVDRTSFYGNPFAVERCITTCAGVVERGYTVRGFEAQFFARRVDAAELSVKAFRAYATGKTNWKLKEAIKLLHGKNLACWCKSGEPCHAEVLLELANYSSTP